MDLAWQLRVARFLRQLRRPLLAAGAGLLLWLFGVRVGSEIRPPSVSLTIAPAASPVAAGEPAAIPRPAGVPLQGAGHGSGGVLAAKPSGVAAAPVTAAPSATAPSAAGSPPAASPGSGPAGAGGTDEGEAAGAGKREGCGEDRQPSRRQAEGGEAAGRQAVGDPQGGNGAPGGQGAAGARAVLAASTSPAVPLDLNKAGPRELDALPGIGPTLARRIVEFREQYGPYRRVDDLLEVPGIGPALLQRIRDRVTVGPEA